jgi:hypothetical protein
MTVAEFFAQSAKHQITRSQAYDDAWVIKSGAVNVEDRQAAWEVIMLEHFELHVELGSRMTCTCVDAAHTMTADEHSAR